MVSVQGYLYEKGWQDMVTVSYHVIAATFFFEAII